MSSESVVIQTKNGRAFGVAVVGSVLLVVAGVVLVLVAMPPVVRALLMVAWLALFALALAAWRSSRSRFAHDEIGLRRLDEYGWELPWGAIERMEIVRRAGQNHLVVEALPGPWQPPAGLPSELLGGLGAAPAGAVTIPGVDELPPRPEQVAPVGVQDRHSSTGLAGQFARLGQAVQAPRVPVAKRDSEQVQAIIDQPRGWVA